LRPYNSLCTPITDYYGWASIKGVYDGNQPPNNSFSYGWYANTPNVHREWGLGLDTSGNSKSCGSTSICAMPGNPSEYMTSIRCFRTL
jgi:hypothetical protein